MAHTLITRNTATRDRHRRHIAKGKPPCGICGEEIDYSLPFMDPMEFVVDHIVPRDLGGPDTLENKQAAHRRCNEWKSNKILMGTDTRRTFVTELTWH